MEGAADERRLRWRCRRGTREMDLMLERFLDAAGEELRLDPQLRARFGRLLEHPDGALFGWLSGRGEPPSDGGLAALVERIRAVSALPFSPLRRPAAGLAPATAALPDRDE